MGSYCSPGTSATCRFRKRGHMWACRLSPGLAFSAVAKAIVAQLRLRLLPGLPFRRRPQTFQQSKNSRRRWTSLGPLSPRARLPVRFGTSSRGSYVRDLQRRRGRGSGAQREHRRRPVVRTSRHAGRAGGTAPAMTNARLPTRRFWGPRATDRRARGGRGYQSDGRR